MIVDIIPHGALKPLIDRHSKANLGSAKNLAWKDVPHGLAQDIFLLEATDTTGIGKACNQRHQFMVHERHSRLNRTGHGHTVASLQQVVRQP